MSKIEKVVTVIVTEAEQRLLEGYRRSSPEAKYAILRYLELQRQEAPVHG